MHFNPGKVWEGETVAIVATGSTLTTSVARHLGVARARGAIKVIAVNDAVYPCWYADICYACDARWWKAHNGLPNFPGAKIKIYLPDKRTKADQLPVPFDDVSYVYASDDNGDKGLCPAPGMVSSGGNSGYQAMNLAVHLGVKTIILVALDLQGERYFGQHPKECRRGAPNYPQRNNFFRAARDDLHRLGVTVLNASPRSALTDYRVVDLEAHLRKIGGTFDG